MMPGSERKWAILLCVHLNDISARAIVLNFFVVWCGLNIIAMPTVVARFGLVGNAIHEGNSFALSYLLL
jgi:hypothetical protein